MKFQVEVATRRVQFCVYLEPEQFQSFCPHYRISKLLKAEQPKIDVYACSWICVVEIFEGHIRKVISIFLQGDSTFEEKLVFWRGHPNLKSVLVSVASDLQVCFVCMGMQSAYNFYFLHIESADFYPLRSPGLDAKRADQ